jgi:hypothetical protein
VVSEVTTLAGGDEEQGPRQGCFQGKQPEENTTMHSLLDLALAGQLDRDRSAVTLGRPHPLRRFVRRDAA